MTDVLMDFHLFGFLVEKTEFKGCVANVRPLLELRTGGVHMAGAMVAGHRHHPGSGLPRLVRVYQRFPIISLPGRTLGSFCWIVFSYVCCAFPHFLLVELCGVREDLNIPLFDMDVKSFMHLRTVNLRVGGSSRKLSTRFQTREVEAKPMNMWISKNMI